MKHSKLNGADPAPAQAILFSDWLTQVEDHLGHIVPSQTAARLYNLGVSVMDAVVRLK